MGEDNMGKRKLRRKNKMKNIMTRAEGFRPKNL
jgi:hypothetical protein